MQHCPSDCHSHIIETFSGVKSGTFVAPDHEYPSHLLLSVDVTDSGGLTAHKPRSSCSRRREPWPPRPRRPGSRSRSGRRPGRHHRPPPGSSSRRSASRHRRRRVVGESTLRVRSLVGRRRADPRRDDRARSDLGRRDLQAHRRRDATAPTAARRSPGPAIPSGTWLPGRFGSAGDVDWYRFKLTSTTRVRLILGDLTAGGRMTLYSGCTKVLEVSDQRGIRAGAHHPAPAGRFVRRPAGRQRRHRQPGLLVADAADAEHRPRPLRPRPDGRRHVPPGRRGLQQHVALGRAGHGDGTPL